MYQTLIDAITSYNPGLCDEDKARVKDALEMAIEAHKWQKRADGSLFIDHPFSVALELTRLSVDINSIIAALLHDIPEDTDVSLQTIEEHFGADIAMLVSGLQKMQLTHIDKQSVQAANMQKLFLAMAEDIRIILIKLCDRLHNLKTLDAFKDRPDKQYRVAKESMDIFVPIADRLGLFEIKVEMQDLAFSYVDPKTYNELALIAGRHKQKEEIRIAHVKEKLETALLESGIVPSDIEWRIKGLYSIHKKMQSAGKNFEDIYDRLALRIIMLNIEECYVALGIIHKNFAPMEERFKDFIANPKDNGYQSLHTTVFIDKQVYEVQIRTQQMDKEAKNGAAAHWVYTENNKRSLSLRKETKAWVERLQKLKEETEKGHFMGEVKREILPDRIYPRSPNGDIYDLPKGATPLDFAYKVHTDLGHSYAGAKVNGQMVSMKYRLKNNDVVEIIRKKEQNPKPEWLAYLKSSDAARSVRSFLKAHRKDENIKTSKKFLENEMEKMGLLYLPKKKIEENIQDCPYESLDAALCAYAEGEYAISKILRLATNYKEVLHTRSSQSKNKEKADITHEKSRFLVSGEPGVYVQTKQCCQPSPGDTLIGFVSKGQGVIVHKSDCKELTNIDPKRYVDVYYEGYEKSGSPYMLHLEIWIENTPGMAYGMFDVLYKLNVHIETFQIKQKPSMAFARFLQKRGYDISCANMQAARLSVSFAKLEIFQEIISELESLPGIYAVMRSSK